jgi:hypothetical protein
VLAQALDIPFTAPANEIVHHHDAVGLFREMKRET